MIKNIQICDKCGKEQENSKADWDTQIKTITAKCPIDGINGGDFSKDLCKECRKLLNEILTNFFKGYYV
jgi:hypothetical protein